MARVLFFSVPLAAAGISSWRWYLQSTPSSDQSGATTDVDSAPVYIPSRFPPAVACDDSEPSQRASILQLHAQSLARLRAGDASQRRLAAASLAQLRGLDDGDCRQLAQTFDYGTSLLLANWRATDLRLFLPPPGARGNSAPLELRLRRLLESLPPAEPCAAFATARALRHLPPADWEPAPLAADPAELSAPTPWRTTPAAAVEADCLVALLERAESAEQRQAMLDGGVLDLLAAAHAERPRDADRCGLLARILAHFPSARQLQQSGWLGVLTAWSRETDVRVAPTAWRVVRNLTLLEQLMESPCPPAGDPPPALVEAERRWVALRSRVAAALAAAGWPSRPAEPGRRRLRPLPDGVLVLHPRSLAAEAATAVDVVFVHGLLGGTARTWRQHDETRAVLPPPAEPHLSETVLRTVSQEGAAGPHVARAENGAKQSATSAERHPSLSSPPPPPPTEAVPASGGPAEPSAADTAVTACGDPGRAAAAAGGEGEVYTQCWPRDWLPADLAPLSVRVLSVDYDSAWSDWRPRCAARRARSLASRAAELRRQLLRAGLGDRPIVWVTHSMGGLLVKQMLVGAAGGGGDSAARDPLLAATRGVLFFSCPHAGSRLASVSPALRPLLLPSAELDALRRDAPPLLELRAAFVSLCSRHSVSCLSVAETRRQRLLGREVMFVEPESAHAGLGRLVLADADHLSVCKPRHRGSDVYRLVVQFVRDVC